MFVFSHYWLLAEIGTNIFCLCLSDNGQKFTLNWYRKITDKSTFALITRKIINPFKTIRQGQYSSEYFLWVITIENKNIQIQHENTSQWDFGTLKPENLSKTKRRNMFSVQLQVYQRLIQSCLAFHESLESKF